MVSVGKCQVYLHHTLISFWPMSFTQKTSLNVTSCHWSAFDRQAWATSRRQISPPSGTAARIPKSPAKGKRFFSQLHWLLRIRDMLKNRRLGISQKGTSVGNWNSKQQSLMISLKQLNWNKKRVRSELHDLTTPALPISKWRPVWPLKSPGLVGPGFTEFLTSDSKWLPGETGEYRTIAQETYPNQMCLIWHSKPNCFLFFCVFHIIFQSDPTDNNQYLLSKLIQNGP